jgi:Amt family ammonium transporter
LFYGGGFTLLTAQAIGSVIVTIATFWVAMVVMYAVNAMGVLRVSPEGERYGLDLHEHGISAYPEYVITSAGTPSGMHSDVRSDQRERLRGAGFDSERVATSFRGATAR